MILLWPTPAFQVHCKSMAIFVMLSLPSSNKSTTKIIPPLVCTSAVETSFAFVQSEDRMSTSPSLQSRERRLVLVALPLIFDSTSSLRGVGCGVFSTDTKSGDAAPGGAVAFTHAPS